jgi:hypothetical protein
MRGVRAEVVEHGADLFGDHPRAGEIARWAQTPEAMPEAPRLEIERHVRACPTCATEAASARDAAATAWRRALAARLARADEAPASAWLRAVPVLAAVALAFPAYLGLVELPRERERARAALEERGALVPPEPAPVSPRPVADPWSGAARTLVLSGATRAEGPVPSISPRPGQPYIPIVLGVEGLPGTGPLFVSITDAGGTEAWSGRPEVASLWDPANRVGTLLVPTALLPPGDYRIDLRSRPGAGPLFSARFRVGPSGG